MVRAVSVLVALAMLPVAGAQAADEVSTTDRLPDRREVAAGDRAYAIGFQDGGWYANGWHITGEMGGIWAPPLKLADGVWFGVDDQWVGPATRFTSGRGYVRYELPPRQRGEDHPHRLRARRRPGALFGLTLVGTGTHTVRSTCLLQAAARLPWNDREGPRPRPTTGRTRSRPRRRLRFADSPHTAFAAGRPARDRRGDRTRLPRPAHRARLRE